MKFAVALAVLATAATVVGASVPDTNAYRLARGLPPKAPVKRATPALRARRGKPSGKPSGQCSTGTQHCCNSVQKASHPSSAGLLGALGINVPSDVLVGSNCSPLTGAGISGNSCSQQPVCCNDDHYNGLIVVGCTPINISL